MRISRNQHKQKKELPLIPLRDMVIFPHSVVPFFVGKEASLKALDIALKGDRDIFIAYQKSGEGNPTIKDIYSVGTVCHILQVLKLPDGKMRVLVEGTGRSTIKDVYENNGIVEVKHTPITPNSDISKQAATLMEAVRTSFKSWSKLQKKLPRELVTNVNRSENPDKLLSHICPLLDTPFEKKIDFLLETDDAIRLQELSLALEMQTELNNLKEDIHGRVRKKMEKTQKDYFLNEQMKEIKKELGKEDIDPSGADELQKSIEETPFPDEIKSKAFKELKRLNRLQPMSPESGVLRTYLEWLTDLPWGNRTDDNKLLKQAKRVLDEDHYHLIEAKERILDFIAVQLLNSKSKGPILCLVGPPGTGKTSLGKSVARALNRRFTRISLGGVRDEAEIRGHRKTYVGALPGKIIQAMKKCGSSNPVFILDEIDKMSNDYRGDPSAALLEVLDPEQNSTFVDHYLEVPFDLSEVMFITTANSLHSIPTPLLDRMEIIQIPGYTELEKLHIARDFILPKQVKDSGLNRNSISITDEAIKKITQDYTMEAGVRNLEKQISKIIRKVLRSEITELQNKSGQYIMNSSAIHKYQESTSVKIWPDYTKIDSSQITTSVNVDNLSDFLGKPKFKENELIKNQTPGIAIGLAWTEVGGRVLPVEITLLPGSGKLILTGKLGEVMKESARIALSFIKSKFRELGIPEDFDKNKDIHIHVPEGAIPKDGPSAGITMTAALFSAISGKALSKNRAMTGEITLTDRLLPIGGLKEKAMAALRHGITHLVIPEGNRNDIEELAKEVRDQMKFSCHSSVLKALTSLFPAKTFKK